jgi:hypothetical protein
MARRADRQRTTAQARAGARRGQENVCGVIKRKEWRPAAVREQLTPQQTASSKKKHNRQDNRHIAESREQNTNNKQKTSNVKHQTSNNKQQTANSRQQGADSRKLNTGGWELGRTRNKRERQALT